MQNHHRGATPLQTLAELQWQGCRCWCLCCFQMPWLCGDATMMEMIEKKRILCREIKARQRPEKNLYKQDSMPILPSWKRKQPPPYSAPPTAAGQTATVFWDTAIWAWRYSTDGDDEGRWCSHQATPTTLTPCLFIYLFIKTVLFEWLQSAAKLRRCPRHQ